MKYVISTLLILFLLNSCNRPKLNRKDDSLKKTHEIIQLVDSAKKAEDLNQLSDKVIIDSLRHELDSIKNELVNRNISLYRQRNRYVEEINLIEERNQFVIDSLKRRIESVNFLTIRRDKKTQLFKYDTIFRHIK